jgi:hypothetical protein
LGLQAELFSLVSSSGARSKESITTYLKHDGLHLTSFWVVQNFVRFFQLGKM